MSQQLSAQISPVEDLSLISSTHMEAQKHM